MFVRKIVYISITLVLIIVPLVHGFMLIGPINNNNSSSFRNLISFNSDLIEESRKSKKKNKYLIGLMFGAILCKLILFPLAVKAMAVMSSISLLISVMGLIISSIVGYAKLAVENYKETVVKIIPVHDLWSKQDIIRNYFPGNKKEYEVNTPLFKKKF